MNMWYKTILALLSVFLIIFTEAGSSRDTDFQTPLWLPQPDACVPGPKGRVPWIIHVREADYGWREHTHRAMIALAMNDYRGDTDEMRKMELQLEVEITKALFRNKTNPIHDSDLALYIHALLATNKNPRNFHGVDLVDDLLHRVESKVEQVNPFLVLALCNAHAVDYHHLNKIAGLANLTHSQTDPTGNIHPDVDSRVAQIKALVYKALACGAKHDPRDFKFAEEMKTITNCLHRKYNESDGSFGNVYTTSLAVQAFLAYRNPPRWWDKSKSLEYLEREAEIDVNLIKAYYIEMALNAKNYKFIRDLYKGEVSPGPVTVKQDTIYVQYTIKKNLYPDMYFSLTVNVENGTSFYEIMKLASNASKAFNFTAYENNEGDPMVYSVAGVPNDVEENMFWRLCKQSDVDHDRHSSVISSQDQSPARIMPRKDEHFIYLYSNTECPTN